MKMVSKVALGMALALGAVSVTATPAVAQKKKEKQQEQAGAWEPQLSKEFRKAAGPVQEALGKKDYAAATAGMPAVQAAATTPDEKYYVANFQLAIAQGSNNDAEVRKAVTALADTGAGPIEDRGRWNFYAADTALKAKDPAAAIRYLTAAQQYGYVHKDSAGQPTDDLALLLAEAQFQSNQIPQGLATLEKAVQARKAAGGQAPADWYARAASVAYKAKLPAEVGKWTRMQVAAYPTPENWRTALVIYRDANKLDNPTNLDLLRLMRASKSLTSERDYYEYADLASRGGLVGEAKAVIDEGRAAKVFDASNQAIGDIYTSANSQVKEDRAALPNSEKKAAAAADGRIALATGDAYLGYGDFAKAAAMYQLALQKGGVDANLVNTHLGLALAKSGQKDAAKAAFSAVTGQRAELAQFYLLWLDQQA